MVLGVAVGDDLDYEDGKSEKQQNVNITTFVKNKLQDKPDEKCYGARAPQHMLETSCQPKPPAGGRHQP